MDKGDFDGQDHTVSNLKTTLEAKARLFRKIVTATVKTSLSLAPLATLQVITVNGTQVTDDQLYTLIVMLHLVQQFCFTISAPDKKILFSFSSMFHILHFIRHTIMYMPTYKFLLIYLITIFTICFNFLFRFLKQIF